MKRIGIYGAGKGGITVLETITQIRDKKGELVTGTCFFDDNENFIGTSIENLPVYGGKKLFDYSLDIDYLVLAIADRGKKKELYTKIKKKINKKFYTVIHPESYISSSVLIGEGSYIKSGAIIETNSCIGKCCIIDNNSIIPHDNIIEDFVHIAPGATLGSSIVIGERTLVGIGANIITGMTIGSNVIIGAGACITFNVSANSVVVGEKAKIIGRNKG